MPTLHCKSIAFQPTNTIACLADIDYYSSQKILSVTSNICYSGYSALVAEFAKQSLICCPVKPIYIRMSMSIAAKLVLIFLLG